MTDEHHICSTDAKGLLNRFAWDICNEAELHGIAVDWKEDSGKGYEFTFGSVDDMITFVQLVNEDDDFPSAHFAQKGPHVLHVHVPPKHLYFIFRTLLKLHSESEKGAPEA